MLAQVFPFPFGRGQAEAEVGQALEAFLKAKDEEGLIVGAIGIGGRGGTSLIAPALRALPMGVPKVIVSTGQCASDAGSDAGDCIHGNRRKPETCLV